MGLLDSLASLGAVYPRLIASNKAEKIDRAITQIGRKIIIDAELAIELAGRKVGGRK